VNEMLSNLKTAVPTRISWSFWPHRPDDRYQPRTRYSQVPHADLCRVQEGHADSRPSPQDYDDGVSTIVRGVHMRLHAGSHVDAPSHMIKGERSPRVDLNTFIGPAMVADIRHRARRRRSCPRISTKASAASWSHTTDCSCRTDINKDYDARRSGWRDTLSERRRGGVVHRARASRSSVSISTTPTSPAKDPRTAHAQASPARHHHHALSDQSMVDRQIARHADLAAAQDEECRSLADRAVVIED